MQVSIADKPSTYDLICLRVTKYQQRANQVSNFKGRSKWPLALTHE